MGSKITELTTKQQGILKDVGVSSLPNNASAKGLNAAEIKRHFEQPSALLFQWLKRLTEEVSNLFDKAPYFLDAVPADLTAYENGDYFLILDSENADATLYKLVDGSFNQVGYSLAEMKDNYDNLDAENIAHINKANTWSNTQTFVGVEATTVTAKVNFIAEHWAMFDYGFTLRNGYGIDFKDYCRFNHFYDSTAKPDGMKCHVALQQLLQTGLSDPHYLAYDTPDWDAVEKSI